ncbi:MAG: hypothetical protein EPN45_19500 [Rhizobiaceae bacterium]|nr:MAG: hypothetical protein EPN45_19500 [Rhizobiaceae bacterium]
MTEENIQVDHQDDGFEWAIVEIFGHRRHAGRCREEERFGAKMLRVDVPTIPPERTLFDAADAKPEAPIVWTTHFYGGASIFSYTLTDQSTVMSANRSYILPHRYIEQAQREPDDGDPDFDVDGEDEVRF